MPETTTPPPYNLDDDRCRRCGEPYANDLTGLCMDCEVGEIDGDPESIDELMARKREREFDYLGTTDA